MSRRSSVGYFCFFCDTGCITRIYDLWSDELGSKIFRLYLAKGFELCQRRYMLDIRENFSEGVVGHRHRAPLRDVVSGQYWYCVDGWIG